MRVLNLGSINLDKSYRVKHFVKPGETISTLSFIQSFGGKGLNQSIALARAGVEVWHAGFVGNDATDLVAMMRREGLHLDYLKTCEGPTGHAIIQIDENGQNSILIHAGSNGMVSQEYIDEVLKNFGCGDYLVLQNEIPNLDYVIDRARKEDMVIFLNPSPIESARDIVNINLVDYLILNEVEGRILSGKSDYREMLDALDQKYPRATIVLTVGSNGVLCRAHGETLSHGCYKVDVVDTTAAGDTFTGYFISAISQKKPLSEALQIASVAGAMCVAKPGAAMAIPHDNDVEQFCETAQLS